MANRVMVVGLGSMGSAFAMALLKNDYEVTVWNRTASKAAPLLKAGAIQASSVSEGVGVNNLIVKRYGANRSQRRSDTPHAGWHHGHDSRHSDR